MYSVSGISHLSLTTLTGIIIVWSLHQKANPYSTF
nr:MAG TPA: hypothetical protein [Caudoviricetes sp.]